MKLFFIYLIVTIICSLISFFLFLIDKIKAKKEGFRIEEKVLLTMTVLNGAIGSLIGSLVFHHKTRKFYFSLIIILSLLAQCGIGVWFLIRGL